jgi:hypothetical protein
MEAVHRSCLIQNARNPAFWLAAIWRDLPGFTRDDGTRGSIRSQPRQRETNCGTKGKTLTVLEAIKSKNSSGVIRSGRLFVLELRAEPVGDDCSTQSGR